MADRGYFAYRSNLKEARNEDVFTALKGMKRSDGTTIVDVHQIIVLPAGIEVNQRLWIQKLKALAGEVQRGTLAVDDAVAAERAACLAIAVAVEQKAVEFIKANAAPSEFAYYKGQGLAAAQIIKRIKDRDK